MLKTSNYVYIEPIPIYKPLGLTPLQAVKNYARKAGIEPSQKLGYAGRLDPLADGVLLALVGPANKLQFSLTGLPKQYRFSMLLGISTDSYDLMGIPSLHDYNEVSKSEIRAALTSMEGFLRQSYPPYSAVRIEGKPLFWWARQGRLDEIEIPQVERQIYDIKLVQFRRITTSELLSVVEENISLVSGDFRQAEIVGCWQNELSETLDQKWPVIDVELHCSSGTYVRGIAHEVGNRLGCGGTTLSLTRTAVGAFTLDDCLRI